MATLSMGYSNDFRQLAGFRCEGQTVRHELYLFVWEMKRTHLTAVAQAFKMRQ